MSLFKLIYIQSNYYINNDKRKWFDDADRELAYVMAWTGNAFATVFRDRLINKELTDDMKQMTMKRLLEMKGSSSIAKRLLCRIILVEITALVGSALEAWESYDRMNDNSYTDAEQGAYGVKMAGSGLTAMMVGIEGLGLVISSFGSSFVTVSIGGLFAGLMAVGFFVAGVLYILGSLLAAVFKLSDIARWVLNSTWGNKPEGWSLPVEILKLEKIYHKPTVLLGYENRHYIARYSYEGQWKLRIEVPDYLIGYRVGVYIQCKRNDNNIYSPTSPYNVIEKQGKWTQEPEGSPVYSLVLPGSLHDQVTVCVRYRTAWVDSEEVSYLGNSRNKIALEKDEDEKGDLDSNDQDLCYLVPLKPEDYANLREPIKTKSLLVDPEIIDPEVEVK